MTDTLKVLGQSMPNNQTVTDLYTVPGVTSTTVSSVVVCNTVGTMNWFRLSTAIGGVADNVNQRQYSDLPLPGNETFIATIGATLATTDKIRCYVASGANVVFTAYGVEVT